jgi:phage terminase large subunit-like protein
MNSFTVGVDLGQVSDFTAIAAIEETDERAYRVRHLERMRHVPYPDIVARIRTLVAQLPEPPSIAVDATGVGRPVVDMLREADIPGDLYAITLTGGSAVTRGDNLERHVPKRDVASTVAILLQTGRLKVSLRIPDASVLLHELMNFRVKINVNANETYEAWRESDHDDLVLAVGLALWLKERGEDGWVALGRELRRRERSEGPWVDPKTLRLPPWETRE